MNIEIRTWSHALQRYDTCGDWLFDDEGNLAITVSDLGDWRMEALVAVHELVEALLCKTKGISQETVDNWDMAFADADAPGVGEPGADPDCPYHREHVRATSVEHIVAAYLGVDWGEYEDRIAAL
jgi:hypothetical protein